MISKFYLFFSILILLSTISLTASTGRVDNSIIQIGIVQKANELTLRPRGTFSIVDQTTGQSHRLEIFRDYTLSMRSGAINFGPFHFQGQARLLPNNQQSSINVGDKQYRGNFVIKPNPDETFTVVHELGLEEYLYGVLSAEVSSNWPIEALKAQAVVARTFALTNLGRFESQGFDLSNDVRSQAYADIQKQFPNAVIAVHETEGQVLKWHGKLLSVFFHSSCGGRTTDPSLFWGFKDGFPKPLKGVSDPYCKTSPHSDWTAYFTDQDILASLRKSGIDYGQLHSIRIGSRDRGGFVKTLQLRIGRQSYSVRASDFRQWIGTMELKSTKISRIVRKQNGFVFTGHGFGHGVGLCQYGALSLARRGKDYKRILRFYFPGADLGHYDE